MDILDQEDFDDFCDSCSDDDIVYDDCVGITPTYSTKDQIFMLF